MPSSKALTSTLGTFKTLCCQSMQKIVLYYVKQSFKIKSNVIMLSVFRVIDSIYGCLSHKGTGRVTTNIHEENKAIELFQRKTYRRQLSTSRITYMLNEWRRYVMVYYPTRSLHFKQHTHTCLTGYWIGVLKRVHPWLATMNVYIKLIFQSGLRFQEMIVLGGGGGGGGGHW